TMCTAIPAMALADHEMGHNAFKQGEPSMAGAVVCDKAEQIVDYLQASQISDEAGTEVLEGYSQLANPRNEPSCVSETIVFTPLRVATKVQNVPYEGKNETAYVLEIQSGDFHGFMASFWPIEPGKLSQNMP
ncbi:MAG: hypothetical protein AB7F76_19055, partial [Parvibaculaceae bacterium]